MSRAGPGAVMNDNGGQIVKVRAGTRVTSPGHILQQVARHVKSVEWELNVIVELGAGVGRPSKPLYMQAEHVG